jgi:hypothetical protein
MEYEGCSGPLNSWLADTTESIIDLEKNFAPLSIPPKPHQLVLPPYQAEGTSAVQAPVVPSPLPPSVPQAAMPTPMDASSACTSPLLSPTGRRTGAHTNGAGTELICPGCPSASSGHISPAGAYTKLSGQAQA